jgi:hypothetical protein
MISERIFVNNVKVLQDVSMTGSKDSAKSVKEVLFVLMVRSNTDVRTVVVAKYARMALISKNV